MELLNLNTTFLTLHLECTIFSGVTVLLSLTVFQQNVSDSMPVTSLQVPLLGKRSQQISLENKMTCNHLKLS